MMVTQEVLKNVRNIEISTREIINSVLAGAYHSAFKGKGMEFAEVREYTPGDDVRAIDWNVTARTGHPHVKRFMEERELTLLLVVDASSSADFGSVLDTKSRVMATLAALLGFAAIRNNDKVGLLIFTDQVELFIPPSKGKKHAMRVIREMLCFKARRKTTRLSGALDYAGNMLKRRSVVVVLSDFQDEGFLESFKVLRKKHDVLALSVWDPRELELPDVGFLEMEDPETGEVWIADTRDSAFRSEFAALAGQDVRKLKKTFQEISVDFLQILIREDYRQTIRPLVDFFKRRANEVNKRS